jgi:beta-lactam-binding protein with PASTA domain
LANKQIEVPQLLGLTFAEARIVLEQNGITLGGLVLDPNVRDTAAAYIYRQSPEKLNEEGQVSFMQSGQMIDLWLSFDQRVSTDSIIK